MKRLSAILTLILLIASASLLYFIVKDYFDSKGFGFDARDMILMDRHAFIEYLCYTIGFVISIYLNRKRKYLPNIIISGLLVIVYIGVLFLILNRK